MDRSTKKFIIAYTVAIFLVVGYLVFDKINTTKIVSFNLKGTVDTFLLQVSQSDLDETQIKSATIKFNDSLDAAIKEYTREKNVIILVSPAVVGGVEDVTENIHILISQKMNSETK